VLARLRVYAIVSCAQKNCGVSLAGTGNHVLHEVTVPWSIDDCEVIIRREKLLVRDIDCDSALALFLQTIHYVSQTESSLARLGCELFVLVNDVLLDMTCVEEETSYGC